MFRRIVLTVSLLGAMTAGIATAADPEAMLSLTPPFAVKLISSRGVTYCDYFLITNNGILAGGQHVLSNCGLPNGLVSGNFNLGFVAPPYAAIPYHGYNLNSTVNNPQSLFYLFNNDKGTWANYVFDGNAILPVNGGTFRIGPPPPAGVIAGGTPSSVKQ